MTTVQFEKLWEPHTLTYTLTSVYPWISPVPCGQIFHTGKIALALLIRDSVGRPPYFFINKSGKDSFLRE